MEKRKDWFFKTAYTRHSGTLVTKEQYTEIKVAQENRKEKKATELRNWINSMPDHNGITHSHAYPIGEPPTREELEIGIPYCCGTEVQPSRFDKGLWYCRECRTNKLR